MKIKSSVKFTFSEDEIESLIDICLVAYQQDLPSHASALCEVLLDTLLPPEQTNSTEIDCVGMTQ